MPTLLLEIVTPAGLALRAGELDEVVVRRREPEHDPGSEVAILPRHGSLLMRSAAAEVRYRRAGHVMRVAVGPGVTEVLDGRVLMMVAEAGRAAPG